MKLSVSILALLLLAACNGGGGEVTEGNSSAAINRDAPYVWGNKSFPKVIRVSKDFSDPLEVAAMEAMAEKWKIAANGQDMITMGSQLLTPFNYNEDDGILGIYKAKVWPSDLTGNELAITNLFCRRVNVGKSTEHLRIVEADIIINYSNDSRGRRNFDFDYDNVGTSGYDFQTVVLHEMGHFLGLNHIPEYSKRSDADWGMNSVDYKASSVMYPSVSSSINKRDPQQRDINELIYKYNLAPASSGSRMIASSGDIYPEEDIPGEFVKVVMELKKDGECVHKHNGVVVERHNVKFKK